jgi:hypothetical protein
MIYDNGIVGENTKGEKKTKQRLQQQRGDRDFRSLITALINFIRFHCPSFVVSAVFTRVFGHRWHRAMISGDFCQAIRLIWNDPLECEKIKVR